MHCALLVHAERHQPVREVIAAAEHRLRPAIRLVTLTRGVENRHEQNQERDRGHRDDAGLECRAGEQRAAGQKRAENRLPLSPMKIDAGGRCEQEPGRGSDQRRQRRDDGDAPAGARTAT